MTAAVGLKMLLRMFHLPAFVNNYEDLARKAEKEAVTYERYLHELAQLEAHERHNRKIAQLLKRSNLPHEKKLEVFERRRPVRSDAAQDQKQGLQTLFRNRSAGHRRLVPAQAGAGSGRRRFTRYHSESILCEEEQPDNIESTT
jgi:hypothetical protein